jgi:hypothetical protein
MPFVSFQTPFTGYIGPLILLKQDRLRGEISGGGFFAGRLGGDLSDVKSR